MRTVPRQIVALSEDWVERLGYRLAPAVRSFSRWIRILALGWLPQRWRSRAQLPVTLLVVAVVTLTAGSAISALTQTSPVETLAANGVPAMYAYHGLTDAQLAGGGAVADLGNPVVTPLALLSNPRSRHFLPATGDGAGPGLVYLDPYRYTGSNLSSPAIGPLDAPYDPKVITLIRQYFPANQVDSAARVSACESGMRSVVSKPNTDGTRDIGVFQLNDGGTLQGLLSRLGQDPSQLTKALDPAWNVMAAARLYTERGWEPWTCARKLGIYPGS